MNSLGILEPLRSDLLAVENKMHESLEVEHPVLATLLRSVIDHGGKRLRPALLIMASRFSPAADYEKVIASAAAVELLHTASLVHDDLVDNAALRRGSPTLGSTWGGGTTVLIGDYLLARAARLAAQTGTQRLIEKFADTLVVIVDGELREIFRNSNPFSREDYRRRIFGKTASLFSVAAEGGAMLGKAPDEHLRLLRDYGYNLGMAFQINDDVLDFTGQEGVVGKTVGNDLRQNVVTLPLIYYHEANSSDDRPERILNRSVDREPLLSELVADVARSPAIAASLAEANGYAQQAKKVLEQLPDNVIKPLMCELADFVVRRRA